MTPPRGSPTPRRQRARSIEADKAKQRKVRELNDYVAEFTEITGLSPRFDDAFLSALDGLTAYLAKHEVRRLEERRRRFLARVNAKFRLNAGGLNAFYGDAAKRGYTFNYPQKVRIAEAFDLDDSTDLVRVLAEKCIPTPLVEALMARFVPVTPEVTIAELVRECEAPSKLRREMGERDIAGEIIKAQFAAFMWVSLPEQQMHAYFDPTYSGHTYHASFWEQLQTWTPHLFHRDQALHALKLDQTAVGCHADYEAFRDAVLGKVRASYEYLNNYGYLAVLIEPMFVDDREIQWELAGDVTLYAEKHREIGLRNSYFRPERVRTDTMGHVPGLDAEVARFDLANEGYNYKDCFILTGPEWTGQALLLILEKNERDETLVPCPACRSQNVQGNSYPSLGVRSWECNNVLCPDRSKYNRGKRYSFKGLVRQRAIEDPRNEVPVAHVRRWLRDVVEGRSPSEVLEFLVRHYSMADDAVHLVGWGEFGERMLHRTLVRTDLPSEESTSRFWTGAFFERYVHVAPADEPASPRDLGWDGFSVIQGDSRAVLRKFPEAHFDAAVTSPPYYNARDYSQWPNMYAYLYDMFNVNREVFRTLKPGARYYYNIFDYFDNEKTIVFSAMGEKRMILSAYTIDLFRRIGFECLGNIAWDKGDIEGKRGFNAGNYSPFYQSPFNCWEHILVFRKPGGPKEEEVFRSSVFRQPAVIKMIGGKNVHGHTAPFPDALPELCVGSLEPGMVVLDPFGGSLTTARVAARRGVRSVTIELSEDYCLLGLAMKKAEDERLATAQLSLFP